PVRSRAGAARPGGEVMTDPRNAKRPGGNRGADRKGTRQRLDNVRPVYGNHSTGARIPESWRDRLPDPASYYAQCIAKLGKPNATGWAQGQCPFHEDRN